VSLEQGSFPAGTPGNGIPKVILAVVTAFPGKHKSVSHSLHFRERVAIRYALYK